nr:hypothetical protein [Glaciibacter superstes]
MDDFTHADRAQQLRGDIHRLEGELQHLRAQLANLEAAVPAAAQAAQASQASQASQADTTATPANAARAVDKNSSGAQKIALFRRLFAGRTDAYAKRWTSTRTGKSGWSPAVVGGFYTDATTDRDLLPLTDEVIAQHLTGSVSTGSPLTGSFRNGSDFHAGLYPMLPDDTCQLLVCDFDGSDFDGSDFDSNEPDEGGWRADAAA